MAKERLIVNGYIVPGGYGGVAVRRACELIIANPGIPQTEVLKLSVFYSGLNLSQAGWITSPGPKSPATLLWDRRKEGTFRCYPNEHTEKVGGAQAALFDEFIKVTSRNYRDTKFHPNPGDLVRVSQWEASGEGIFLGYQLGQDRRVFGLRSTVEEWIAERPSIEVGDRIYAIILLNGFQRPSLVWNFGSIQPV
jgi:hypothetical protein